MNTLQHNIPKDTTFTITNVGEYPLIIQNVENSCGFTTPSWTRKPIKTGTAKGIIPSKAGTEIKEEATIIKNKYESSGIIVKPKGKKQEASMCKQTNFCLTPLSNAKKGGGVTM